jgi:hypothetical protein
LWNPRGDACFDINCKINGTLHFNKLKIQDGVAVDAWLSQNLLV